MAEYRDGYKVDPNTGLTKPEERAGRLTRSEAEATAKEPEQADGDWLTIERKGFFGRVGHSKGDRRIPLASITAVQVRPAGSVANGFIRFTLPGSPELRGGLQNASKDENAVIFKKSQADDFERVRLAVEHYIIAKHSGGAPIAAAPDIPEQIKKLGELREQGLLTDEQFEAKRDELLSRM